MARFLSISPNRLAVYHGKSFDERVDSFHKPKIMPANRRKASGEMSQKARNRLRTALNWLVCCSQSRNVRLKDGHFIKNFQIAFITLHLPTKQMHSHQEIKSKCLNLFLQNLRKKFGVTNYVWKAELQKNGNIHFHLSIDKPIHYMIVRYYWNLAIEKLGYVSEYQKIRQSMSYDVYSYWRAQEGVKDTKKIKRSYDYGQATAWANPNTTDTKSVKNMRNWASYMAKYMAKECADKDKTGIISDSLDELVGRVWFCSQSLSKLGCVKLEFEFDHFNLVRKFARCKKVFDKTFDYCRLLYFQIKALPQDLREFLRNELLSHAVNTGYVFPANFPKW